VTPRALRAAVGGAPRAGSGLCGGADACVDDADAGMAGPHLARSAVGTPVAGVRGCGPSIPRGSAVETDGSRFRAPRLPASSHPRHTVRRRSPRRRSAVASRFSASNPTGSTWDDPTEAQKYRQPGVINLGHANHPAGPERVRPTHGSDPQPRPARRQPRRNVRHEPPHRHGLTDHRVTDAVRGGQPVAIRWVEAGAVRTVRLASLARRTRLHGAVPAADTRRSLRRTPRRFRRVIDDRTACASTRDRPSALPRRRSATSCRGVGRTQRTA
jgi:hypothetical protein